MTPLEYLTRLQVEAAQTKGSRDFHLEVGWVGPKSGVAKALESLAEEQGDA